MPGARKEDTRMKIPALIHLTRLGYGYLFRGRTPRDREDNALPEVLGDALERINGRAVPEEEFRRLRTAMREAAGRKDLGRALYRMIRDGWEGLRLIDFDRPEFNRFDAAAEVSFGRGGRSFRPDLTLYVNGMPLALVELKTREQPGGIRTEYDRMLERFRRAEFRPFLQAAQVWAFCNDRENDPDRLLPTEGAWYGAAAEGDFCLHAFREGYPATLPALRPRDREAERAILADCGMEGRITAGELRRNLSPGTAAHRMLTGLFSPERFLFFLRYGICWEEDGARKRLLSAAQFFALWRLENRMRQGRPGGVLPAAGAAGEIAFLASLITWTGERMPGSRVYWFMTERAEMLQARNELRGLGIPSGRRGLPESGRVLYTGPAEFPAKWIRDEEESAFDGQRIFLIPAEYAATPRGKAWLRNLRKALPGAVRILRHGNALPERGNYTYLLECADGSLYCGWTDNLERRVRTHNEGRGAKYTRSRRPVKLVYAEKFDTREEAMSREWHLKQMTRAEKLRLIREAETGGGEGEDQA